MKLIKAKVYFKRDEKGTFYGDGYPKDWDATRIPFIVYCDEGSEADGRTFQWMVVALPDDLADTLLQDPQSTTIDNAEATSYSDAYFPAREIVNDSNAVISVLAKKALGNELSQSELDVLTPSSPTPGITMSKSAVEIWRDYGIQI